jgi:hypothetical protein
VSQVKGHFRLTPNARYMELRRAERRDASSPHVAQMRRSGPTTSAGLFHFASRSAIIERFNLEKMRGSLPCRAYSKLIILIVALEPRRSSALSWLPQRYAGFRGAQAPRY